MGLPLSDAWMISPRSLRVVTRARHEVDLDELDQKIQAAYAGEYFRRQKRLGGEHLKKMLPKRRRAQTASSGAGTLEAEIARHDAWAKGVNQRAQAAANASGGGA